MNKKIKWLGIIVASLATVLVVALGIAYALSNSRMSQKFTVTVQAPPLPATPTALQEGKRIFLSRGCIDCHGENLAGRVIVDDPLIGRLEGANLTKGNGGIGGSFTDEDFVRAIRHGVRPDGSALIFMPSTDFQAMSDAEIGPLIAYIRSVPAVNKPAPKQVVGPLSRVLFLLGQSPLLVTAELIDHSTKASTVVSGVTVEYGRHIANYCTGCHGPGFSGGTIPGAPPDWLPAANITPQPAVLGAWSEADFLKALREGVRPDGSKVRFPMPVENTRLMTDAELKALWMFLRTVPVKATGGR